MSRKQLDINFFDRSAIDNPWPLYEEARAAGRVVWNEIIHGWMVTGFDDCSQVLTDDGEQFSAVPSDPQILPWFEAPTMISTCIWSSRPVTRSTTAIGDSALNVEECWM